MSAGSALMVAILSEVGACNENAKEHRCINRNMVPGEWHLASSYLLVPTEGQACSVPRKILRM